MHTGCVEAIIPYDAIAVGCYVSLKAVMGYAVLLSVACGFILCAGLCEIALARWVLLEKSKKKNCPIPVLDSENTDLVR